MSADQTDSLRVLIISDSHGRTDRIRDVIRQVGKYDLLLHAGDHAVDVLEDHPDARAVCGNCDAPDSAEVEQVFELLGVRTLLTHGHRLNVKASALPMLYRAAEQEVGLFIFGHTHTPTLLVEQGRVFLNPGSLSYPRGYTVCTYAVLELKRAATGVEASFAFYTLDGERIPAFDLTHLFS
jgi:putative phosphoesterase